MKGEFLSIETAQIMTDMERENDEVLDVYLKCAKERYELLEKNEKLESEILKLKNIINEAIIFIKDHDNFNTGMHPYVSHELLRRLRPITIEKEKNKDE